MSLHIIRIEQGNVSTPAQPNGNPSVAQSPTQGRGQNPVGVALKSTAFIQAGKQIYSGVVSNVGFATGNYELQEKAEAITKLAGIGIGLAVAPIATGFSLAISGAFELYKVNETQKRNQFRQQQQQVLTGKISTNGGVWV